MSIIRVLIVEDDPLIAATLKRMLVKLNYEVLGIASSFELALYDIDRLKPDVVLLDICLGSERNGIHIGAELQKRFRIPFLYITALANQETVKKAKLTEPLGYIMKPFDQNDIRVNLEIALYNHAQKSKSRDAQPDWSEINRRLEISLTRREIDVLKQLFEGKTNAKIASDLYLSVNTVKSHLIRLYQKLGVTARTEALAKVRALQNVEPKQFRQFSVHYY